MKKKTLTKKSSKSGDSFSPWKMETLPLSPKHRINFLLFIFLAKFRHAPRPNCFFKKKNHCTRAIVKAHPTQPKTIILKKEKHVH
jgi:hypothetical protein